MTEPFGRKNEAVNVDLLFKALRLACIPRLMTARNWNYCKSFLYKNGEFKFSSKM